MGNVGCGHLVKDLVGHAKENEVFLFEKNVRKMRFF